MIKIKYPKDSTTLSAFEKAYVEKLRSELDNYIELKKVLAKIKLANGNSLSWEYLVTAPFNELIDLNSQIDNKKQGNLKRLRPLATYKNLHSSIAEFFMEQKEINLDSCYYCNIDSIYSFSQIGDYKDGLDFINRADLNQLVKIKGVGKVTAKKIIKNRAFVKIDDCPVSNTIKADLTKFELNLTHNHFTLDHYLHQANYPYLSLCLYNFVPSCYVCNSKYKGKHKLYSTDPLKSNPASSAYSFHKDVVFKIFYHRSDKSILTQDDFAIDLKFNDNRSSHEVYIDRLNIRGRYTFHKKKAFGLVQKKIDYPETRIRELSNALGKPMDEIRKQIFGREIFDTDYEQSSLVKYKRDIAKNIKLIT